MKNVNVDKIVKNIDKAIKDRDCIKMMEIKSMIDDAVKEDRFKVRLYDEDGEIRLTLNKDFQMITLNEEECKEVFSQLGYANDFNWKILF